MNQFNVEAVLLMIAFLTIFWLVGMFIGKWKWRPIVWFILWFILNITWWIIIACLPKTEQRLEYEAEIRARIMKRVMK